MRPGWQRIGGQHRLGQAHPRYDSGWSPLPHSLSSHKHTAHISSIKSLIRSVEGLFWLVAAKTLTGSPEEGGNVGLAACYLSVKLLCVRVCVCMRRALADQSVLLIYQPDEPRPPGSFNSFPGPQASPCAVWIMEILLALGAHLASPLTQEQWKDVRRFVFPSLNARVESRGEVHSKSLVGLIQLCWWL